MLALLWTLGFSVNLWATRRCVDCGECSENDFICGLCVVAAVQQNCSQYGPGAYCECNGGEWACDCDN